MIPTTAHFIWLGRTLPWATVLAVRSAAARGGLDRVVLHHDADLSSTPHWAELAGTPGLETRLVSPRAVLRSAPFGEGLARAYDEVGLPSSRANVLRAAVLALEGGVYLDADTVTVGSLRPLLERGGAFCGEERIALPARVLRSREPSEWARAGLAIAVREGLRLAPGGHRLYRRLEHLGPRAVNNAVVAAEPGHPFVLALLRRMVELPSRRRRARYAMGTHLLQDAVEGYRGGDLTVYPPAYFYPLGPEISEHWFRRRRAIRLEDFLEPETRVVHWYASVRTRAIVPRLSPEHVRRNATTEAWSALARDLLP